MIVDWAPSKLLVTNETVLINGEIYRSNSERTTGLLLDAIEIANFTKISFNSNIRQFVDNTTVAPALT